jgi:hypothetical protein
VQSAKPTNMTPKVFFRWIAWLLVLAIAIFTLAPIEFRPVTAAPARASDRKLDSWASARVGVVIHLLDREVDHGSLLFS